MEAKMAPTGAQFPLEADSALGEPREWGGTERTETWDQADLSPATRLTNYTTPRGQLLTLPKPQLCFPQPLLQVCERIK